MITFSEFMDLSVEDMVKFDFFGQGTLLGSFTEAELPRVDESKVLKEIYSKLYPWYQNFTLYGDSMNTYRTGIYKFYNNYYRKLPVEKQNEIDSIVKSNTLSHENHIFTFEVRDTDKKSDYKQISNNYQLGNFFVLPGSKGNTINSDRAKAPYDDFFDLFLIELEETLYQNPTHKFPKKISKEATLDTKLQKSIYHYSEYFKSFNSFNEYIEMNFLQDFFDENNNLIRLSEIESFEEYVYMVNKIINKRSKRIADYLTKNYQNLK